MGFLTLADQLKKGGDPMAAQAKAASGYQPGEYAGLPPAMPQSAPVQYAPPPPEQDASQYSPEVIAPQGIRNMQLPGEQSNIGPAPLPQEYQRQQDALFQPGPLQQRYSQAALNGPGEAPHGFLGHLKGAGLGFLLGGPVGAVTGAIAPGIPQRALFRGVQLPQLAQQADQEMQQQGQQRQGYHALAQSTGYDPITHQPTLPMVQAQSLMGNRLFNQQLGAGRLNESTRQHDLQNEDRDAALQWRRQFGEQRLAQHQQGLDNGSHQLVKGMTANGKVGWFSVNKADPSDVVQIADADGKQLETPDAMLEGGRNARFAAGQANMNTRQDKSIAAANTRQDKSITAAGVRQDKGIAAADRRAAKRSGGLLEAARQQMGQGGQSPSTQSPVTRSIYDQMVKEKGQARTDAYLKAKGWPIPE